MRYLLIIAALLLATPAWSQTAQSNAAVAQPPDSLPKVEITQGAKPFVVEPVEDKRATQREEEDLVAQKDMARYSLLMFIASMVTAAIVYFQLRYTREATNAALVAAGAADKQHATFLKIERAYVFAEIQLDHFVCTLLTPPRFGSTRAMVNFWNYGKTPAVITKIRGYIDLLQSPPDELLAPAAGDLPLPPSLGIATNVSYPVPLERILTTSEVGEALSMAKRVFFVGRIEYEDVHGNPFVTGFCWELVVRSDGSSYVTLSRESKLNVRT